MIAHAGGIDEMLFVLVPLIVFLALQWLNRRKARAPDTDEDLEERLARRHRLAGGLIPNPETERPKTEDPPHGTAD